VLNCGNTNKGKNGSFHITDFNDLTRIMIS